MKMLLMVWSSNPPLYLQPFSALEPLNHGRDIIIDKADDDGASKLTTETIL